MISYAVYKVLHLTGVLMVFLALGGAATQKITAGAPNWRKSIMITHGVGMLLSLVGGFGLLARLGIVHGGLPGWATAKLAIWVFFALAITLVYRVPKMAKIAWPLVICLGATAAYLAGSKPF